MNGNTNLLVYETWSDDKICLNPLVDIVNKQDIAYKIRLSLHKLTNRTNTNIRETSSKLQKVLYLSLQET